MAPGDDRDLYKPKAVARPALQDPDITPIEGTQVAFSLRSEMASLREDFRVHSLVDAQGLEAIRVKQEAQAGHITGILVETAKQTVMLENMRDVQRRTDAETDARKRTRHDRMWEIGKWMLGIAGGLVLGWFTHRYLS